jgi:hypothetical protein
MSTIFSLFVFDALGDAVEADNAYWSIFVVNSIPLFIWLIPKYYKIYNNKKKYYVDESMIGLEMNDNIVINPITSIRDEPICL